MDFVETASTPDPPRSDTTDQTAADDTASDAPRPPALKLAINEVDYDQAGADTAEFVEIVNPNTTAVDLADYRIELVNGSNGRRYGSYTGTGRLAAGGYFVIADQTVIDSVPGGTVTAPLKSGGLQNGPDAIRIVEAATGRVLDGVHYMKQSPASGKAILRRRTTPANRRRSADAPTASTATTTARTSRR